MTEQQAIKRIKTEMGWESEELNREAFEMGIKALEEVQQYRALGGTPELIGKIIHFLCDVEDNSIIKDLELLNQYRVLGTVEELKEARGKQIAKKPVMDYPTIASCPMCDEVIYPHTEYCPDCGQKLDWGNEDAE